MLILSTAVYRLRVYCGNIKILDTHCDSVHDANAYCDYLRTNLHGKAKAFLVKIFKSENYLSEDVVFSRVISNTIIKKDSSCQPFPFTMFFKRKRRNEKDRILSSFNYKPV